MSENRIFQSLRSRLLAWVLLPITVAVGLGAWIAHGNAQEIASVVQDQLLLGSARIIAEQIRFEDSSFQNQIPPAALELFQSTRPDRVYYRLTAGDGHLLAGYPSLPSPSAPIPGDAPYFFDTHMRGSPVRVVVLLQPVISAPNAAPVVVEVAQTMQTHDQLSHQLWMHSMHQQLFILALAALFILLGVNRGLNPVLKLRDIMQARKAGTLDKIELERAPAELKPLIAAINDYMQRIEAHAGAQSVFLQNAAHQLRTPFAVLQTQLNFAARAQDEIDKNQSISAARSTLQDASRLVNQLLTLSASESAPQAGDATDVALAVQSVFEKLTPQAFNKNIALEFDHAGLVATVPMNSMALHEILVNLVDNAIRYSAPGGRVTVRFYGDTMKSQLIVEDCGPGIALAYREKVFERFFRIDNRTSDGSGLGLAIVRQFALQAGAEVVLATPEGGKGLSVNVTFTQHFQRAC